MLSLSQSLIVKRNTSQYQFGINQLILSSQLQDVVHACPNLPWAHLASCVLALEQVVRTPEVDADQTAQQDENGQDAQHAKGNVTRREARKKRRHDDAVRLFKKQFPAVLLFPFRNWANDDDKGNPLNKQGSKVKERCQTDESLGKMEKPVPLTIAKWTDTRKVSWMGKGNLN